MLNHQTMHLALYVVNHSFVVYTFVLVPRPTRWLNWQFTMITMLTEVIFRGAVRECVRLIVLDNVLAYNSAIRSHLRSEISGLPNGYIEWVLHWVIFISYLRSWPVSIDSDANYVASTDSIITFSSQQASGNLLETVTLVPLGPDLVTSAHQSLPSVISRRAELGGWLQGLRYLVPVRISFPSFFRLYYGSLNPLTKLIAHWIL